jgi:hypothetical protein
MGSPKRKLAIKLMMACANAIGKRGKAYPRMKSLAESGDANSRIRNDVLRSLEMRVPENRETNDNPKTAVIPGANWLISNIGTGTLA